MCKMLICLVGLSSIAILVIGYIVLSVCEYLSRLYIHITIATSAYFSLINECYIVYFPDEIIILLESFNLFSIVSIVTFTLHL